MRADGFTVWITGADETALRALAHEVAAALTSRPFAVELLDGTTPGIAALAGEGSTARAVFVARLLARHGVATVIALPEPRRAERERARAEVSRLMEVWVHRPGEDASGYEPPDRPEVEVMLPDPSPAATVGRIVQTLEVLEYLPRGDDRAYSAAEEREVLRRLKAFGYI
jgi:hypothetical protein